MRALLIFLFVTLLLFAIVACDPNSADAEAAKWRAKIPATGVVFVVAGTSMEPELVAGDHVLVKVSAIEAIKVGDNITFIPYWATKGGSPAPVTHKVVAIRRDGLVTEGVNNPVSRTSSLPNDHTDPSLVTAANLIGVATKVAP